MSEINYENTSKRDRRKQRMFGIYILAICLPFTFGGIGPVANVLWIEWLAPIMLVILMFKLLSMSKSPVPYGGRLSSTAILLFLLCAVGHYVFHPVSSQMLFDAGRTAGGLRAYFDLFISVCIFFTTFWLTAYWQTHEATWRTIFRIILFVALFIGFARLGTYFIGVDMPMLAGVFTYHEDPYIGVFKVERAHRIGGLAEAATLGFAALLALNIDRRWNSRTYILLYVLLFMMVMGGGRSSMVGLLLALLIYFILLRRETGKAILFVLLMISVMILALQLDLFTRQFGRLSNIAGGIEANQSGRGLVFKEMWRIFLENPLFGKGIGKQFIGKNLPENVVKVVHTGGHGSYFSVLGLFGLIGVFNFFANLFRPAWVGLRLLRKRTKISSINDGMKMAITFALCSLVILIVEYTVAGNGYGYMQFKMYLCAGIISGIVMRINYAK